MKKIERLRKKTSNFFFDHFILNSVVSHTRQFLYAIISAAIFAFGFCAFVTPAPGEDFTVVTGGVSGISQNIALVIQMATGEPVGNNTVQAISYFAINIPIFVFAFFAIGKRFAIYTLITVGASSLFISLFSISGGLGEMLASNSLISNSVLSRVIFAGVCTGISSAFAFRGDISCGGIDVFTYYFALRKSTSVGKYGVAINGIIVSLYALLLIFYNPADWDHGVISLLYSIAYLLFVAIIIDAINLRNKKVQITIITKDKNLPHILIANFPHGATEINAHGVYSGGEELVVYMIVSSSEVKRVVALAKKVDLHVFATVTPLAQVYGNFFIKPVE